MLDWPPASHTSPTKTSWSRTCWALPSILTASGPPGAGGCILSCRRPSGLVPHRSAGSCPTPDRVGSSTLEHHVVAEDRADERQPRLVLGGRSATADER